MASANYPKGQVVIIDLGKPPGSIVGHEQAYTRPCIVVKHHLLMGLLTIVPCTTKEPKSIHYSIVPLQKRSGDLAEDSFVLCHQIRTVSESRVLDRKGRISQHDFLRIRSVLLDILEL